MEAGAGDRPCCYMTTIEKTILKVLTNKWQKLPQIQEQVAEKMGDDPNSLEELVPIFCGILAGLGEIEMKSVPLKSGVYYPVFRKKQAKQEVRY